VVVDRIRTALTKQADQNKLHVLVGDEPIVPKPQAGGHTAARKTGHGTVKPHDYAKARAAALAGHGAPSAHGGEVHWEYEGEHGPEQWGNMKPEFNTCSSGKRQSPIHIQSIDTAPGPAEPIEFHYSGSGGSVVNNGHTIQVDSLGHNWIKVRGSAYKLVQFHFHHPAEEKINYKGFAMVAHLVHKNEAGQLAVVAVLMDVGANNPFLQKVWTRMPLEVQDRVALPDDLLNLNELLPGDQRYYQFMGSLTTPPCSEGVLWMVLKQPVTLGPDQLKLFTKLFPMNARPVQAVNGRLVREAM
jgi:carbonic anhydrase